VQIIDSPLQQRRFEMDKKTWMLATAVLASATALMASPAAAYTSVGVQIGVPATVYVAPPPPPPVYQHAPAPRRGHVWVPGHWEWQGNRHAWVQGVYMRERPGYVYQQPQWVSHGDRWGYRAGHWQRRDRDRDGIPNRYDRDRDGDGVPNRFDRSPNNPYRR
jgi:hypothetical protein